MSSVEYTPSAPKRVVVSAVELRDIPVAPVITSQPAAATVNLGSSFSLSVVAYGNPALSYQWYKNGAPISGATSPTYTVGAALTSSAAEYFVRVTNGLTSVDSSSVAVTVLYAPVINVQPAATTALVGDDVTLTVSASGVPNVSYQWKKNGVDLPGETGASLVLSGIDASDDATYSAVVTNDIGAVTSSGAHVTVHEVPHFTAQPSPITVNQGSPFSLTAVAAGIPSPTYQWFKDGVAISGATSSTYSVGSAVANQGGSYYCIATNVEGSVQSDPVAVNVQYAPVISSQPSSLSVPEGDPFTLVVVASGNPGPLTYQWKKNGADIPGATSASYHVAVSSSTDEANYTVVVTNALGSVTSSVAAVDVAAPYAPVFTTQPISQNGFVGEDITLFVAVDAFPAATFQWKKNGVDIPGATSASFTITDAQLSDSGDYRVVATNSVGSIVSNIVTATVLEEASSIDTTNLITELKFDEGSGTFLRNSRSSVPSDNLMIAPEGRYDKEPWNISGYSVTQGFTDRDGGNRACRLLNFSNPGTDELLHTYLPRLEAGTYTLSYWAKSNNGTTQKIRPRLPHGGTWGAEFTLPSDGSWVRVTQTTTVSATTRFHSCPIAPPTGAYPTDYPTDFLVYGMKLEAGSVATDYVPQDGDFRVYVPNSAELPSWVSGGLLVNTATNKRVSAVSNFPLKTFTEASIYAVFKWPKETPVQDMNAVPIVCSDYGSGTDRISLNARAGISPATGDNPVYSPAANFGGAGVSAFGANIRDGEWHVMTFTVIGGTGYFFIDGVLLRSTSVNSPGAVREWWLNNEGGGWMPGIMGYLAIYDVGHTTTKVKQQFAALQAIMLARSQTLSGANKFVAFEGDSISTPYATQSYPQRVIEEFVNAQSRIFSAAGSRLAEEVVPRATTVDSFLQAGRKNVLCLLIGCNDNGTYSAAAYYSMIKSYCLARRASGWKIVLCTMTPCTEAARPGFEVWRSAVRGYYLSDTTFYDVLCDFQANADVGVQAAASDTSKYGDGVHPTAYTHGVLKTVMQPALEAAFAL